MHWICQNLRCVSMGNFPRWSYHTPAAPVFTHSHNSGQSHRFLLSSPPPPPSRPLFTRLTVYQANMSDRRWVSALCRGKYLKFTCGPRCPLQLHTHRPCSRISVQRMFHYCLARTDGYIRHSEGGRGPPPLQNKTPIDRSRLKSVKSPENLEALIRYGSSQKRNEHCFGFLASKDSKMRFFLLLGLLRNI